MNKFVKATCVVLGLALVNGAFAAKSEDGEKIDLADIEARLSALEAGVTSRANGGLYLVTSTEVNLNGNCLDPTQTSIGHQAERGWALAIPNADDADRMDLFLNYDSRVVPGATDPSLAQFRSDFELRGGAIYEDAIRRVIGDRTPATVFVEGGEITLDPDTATPWEPAPGERPPHYNNQVVWGAMSDDGGSFTIVAHLITDSVADGEQCDRASLITLTGVRQRAF